MTCLSSCLLKETQLEPQYPFSFILMLSGIPVNPPDIKIITEFIVLMGLLFASALMSGSEVAYFSFRPDDIEKLKSDKSKKAQTALKHYQDPEKLLSTILVANNTINIAVVLLSAFISSRIFDFSAEPVIGFIINAVAITFLLLFFGEILPKVYATRNHVNMALFMALPLRLFQQSGSI